MGRVRARAVDIRLRALPGDIPSCESNSRLYILAVAIRKRSYRHSCHTATAQSYQVDPPGNNPSDVGTIGTPQRRPTDAIPARDLGGWAGVRVRMGGELGFDAADADGGIGETGGVGGWGGGSARGRDLPSSVEREHLRCADGVMGVQDLRGGRRIRRWGEGGEA